MQATRELLRRAQQGDRGALDDLIARYHDRVAGMVRVRLHGRLRPERETRDIVHDVCISFVRNLQTFEMRDEASLVTYLATIAHNRLLDALRDEKRRPEVEPAAGDNDGEAPEAHARVTDPLDGLLRTERRDVIEACLAELSEAQRELILLRSYAGHAWEEVAAQTGRPSADAARVGVREGPRRPRPQGAAPAARSPAGRSPCQGHEHRSVRPRLARRSPFRGSLLLGSSSKLGTGASHAEQAPMGRGSIGIGVRPYSGLPM